MVGHALVLASNKPGVLDSDDLKLIESDIRNAYLPISDEDARVLLRVDETHQPEFSSEEKLPALARLFDHHRMLRYKNGDEWYAAHPIAVSICHV